MYRTLSHGIPEKFRYHTPQRGSVQKSSKHYTFSTPKAGFSLYCLLQTGIQLVIRR